MVNKRLLSIAMIVSMSFFSQVSFADDVKCGASASDPDAECAKGTVCILAMDPPVCKPPLAKGSACKRDKVCASNKCEKPEGAGPKDKGTCK